MSDDARVSDREIMVEWVRRRGLPVGDPERMEHDEFERAMRTLGHYPLPPAAPASVASGRPVIGRDDPGDRDEATA